jgi:hypothetical protein
MNRPIVSRGLVSCKLCFLCFVKSLLFNGKNILLHVAPFKKSFFSTLSAKGYLQKFPRRRQQQQRQSSAAPPLIRTTSFWIIPGFAYNNRNNYNYSYLRLHVHLSTHLFCWQKYLKVVGLLCRPSVLLWLLSRTVYDIAIIFLVVTIVTLINNICFDT